jgi:hypothetical protein
MKAGVLAVQSVQFPGVQYALSYTQSARLNTYFVQQGQAGYQAARIARNRKRIRVQEQGRRWVALSEVLEM